jgi:hypothetical protein
MAEKKQQHQLYVLGGLLVVAALVWYFGTAKGLTGGSGFSVLNGTYTPINAQDFGSVFEKLKSTETTEYKTSGRNIFTMMAIVEEVPIKIEKPVFQNKGPVPPPPPPPPPPAQLSWKFFGYGNLPAGGPRQAFLLDGDEVRIVGEGDTVQNHIRILRIGNDKIEFEDLNTHQVGSNQLEPMPGPAA